MWNGISPTRDYVQLQKNGSSRPIVGGALFYQYLQAEELLHIQHRHKTTVRLSEHPSFPVDNHVTFRLHQKAKAVSYSVV